jgi:hypothetical protein
VFIDLSNPRTFQRRFNFTLAGARSGQPPHMSAVGRRVFSTALVVLFRPPFLALF